MLTGVAYSTAYRYRTSYGEYRGGRIHWRVRERLQKVSEAQAYVRKRGAIASDETAELASELLSDVKGLPEDIRDVLVYYNR